MEWLATNIAIDRVMIIIIWRQ